MRNATTAAMVAALLVLAGGVAGALRLTSPDHGGLALTGGLVYRGGGSLAPKAVRAANVWCGTDAASSDRIPDAAVGAQIHVVYAIPSDGGDRFATMASAIDVDVAAIDAWWRQQDPARAPRWDLYAFPGCAAGLDQLDISRVQLSQPASYYAPVQTRASAIIFELGSTFSDPGKKYLVYYDGPVEDPRLCGQSSLNPDRGGRFAYSVVYAQACHADVGAGSLTASVAAHELVHNLGAVPPGGPPNACPGDSAHICDDQNDLMYPYTQGQGLNAVALDVGRNDYYGHSASWFDLQDSPWLDRLDAARFPLTVSIAGSGSGGVTSDLPGISCPSSCSGTFDSGTRVRLAAAPGEHTRFVGWSGACSADPCDVSMTAVQTVVARFVETDDVTVTLKRTRGASGSVVSRPAGISCPGTCSATWDKDTRVRLIPVPGRNISLAAWGGACSGRGRCSFTVAAGTAVTATFAPKRAPAPARAYRRR